ncbi:hypothetical protein DFH27DRAFT_522125 [Peziza echinospora]|nr:hypothetical protein DFH27DRAFT_522125 [Peziza echinospora]
MSYYAKRNIRDGERGMVGKAINIVINSSGPLVPPTSTVAGPASPTSLEIRDHPASPSSSISSPASLTSSPSSPSSSICPESPSQSPFASTFTSTPISTPSEPIPETLPPPITPLPSYPANHALQSSPYPSHTHLLPLLTLSPALRLVSIALTALAPITPQYATTAYKHAFNWPVIVSTLRELHQTNVLPQDDETESEAAPSSSSEKPFPHTEAYIIVFRSRVPPDYNAPRLHDLDILAHEEANLSGGLLKYWFGTPDADGRNLATCLWRHQADAKMGGKGEGHKCAMREVAGHYLEWTVERLRLVVYEGAEKWDIVQW